MMEGDGKCKAEAEARGLPANTDVCFRQTQAERDRNDERKTLKMGEVNQVIEE